MTTRGMKESECKTIAELIDRVISSAEKPDSGNICQAVREEIRVLCMNNPIEGYSV
jgi:glycine hydroxymethyltransferase